MTLPVEVNPLLLGGNQGGYQISRSVRLRSSASAYFNRTLTTPTDGKKWTYSTWVKRGILTAGTGTAQQLISAGSATAFFRFSTTDTLVSGWTGASNLETTQVFRDPSAWYHIMLVVDTTQATAANRVKYYVNGVQITAFSTTDYPTQNSTTTINSATAHNLGAYTSSSQFFDGYITEVNFIDGQALTPSSFGETDAVTGVWKPKKYAGTYGTNGFYLNFSDNSAATAAAIGKDSSGNGNNWTPNNISLTAGVTYDSMIDTPTPYADGGNGRGNYSVINPLAAGADATISNANLSVSYGSGGTVGTTLGTMGMSSGKWYWENTVTASSLAACTAYVGLVNQSNPTGAGSYPGATSRGWSYYGNLGNFYNNGSTIQTGLATYGATNDVVGVAFDADAGTLQFYKNGTQIGTTITGIAADTYFPAWSDGSVANTFTLAVNFGQRPFAYTPPSGFKALNTQNLPDPTIKAGNKWFDATTYTGNGTSQNVVNSGGFQPDFVWYKDRSVARDHGLFDSSRGALNLMSSNTTGAESSVAGTLTSFNSNGYSIGSAANANGSGETYVGWQWKKGATPGFDVVTYTGNGTARTIAHSLGVAPSMILIKCRDSATDPSWIVGHTGVGMGSGRLILNGTDTNSTAGAASLWNSTAATSSVFSLGTYSSVNQNTLRFVAYLFAEVAGFSKFGSYTGNGSADGPFVFCGFRPRFVLIKRTDAVGQWGILDTARNTYNTLGNYLIPSSSAAEDTVYLVDLLSNGFKPRVGAGYALNDSGGTYVYAAFAENPFKYSLAR